MTSSCFCMLELRLLWCLEPLSLIPCPEVETISSPCYCRSNSGMWQHEWVLTGTLWGRLWNWASVLSCATLCLSMGFMISVKVFDAVNSPKGKVLKLSPFHLKQRKQCSLDWICLILQTKTYWLPRTSCFMGLSYFYITVVQWFCKWKLLIEMKHK